MFKDVSTTFRDIIFKKYFDNIVIYINDSVLISWLTVKMYERHFIILVATIGLTHTDLVLDLIGHTGYFVEQTQ